MWGVGGDGASRCPGGGEPSLPPPRRTAVGVAPADPPSSPTSRHDRKLNGDPCDGDLDSDITRYICFIAESGSQGCSAKNQGACPPFHILSGSHVRVYPNDTARFPHSCYSGHCAPGACDPYSNPGPQELMMLLPCSEVSS